MTFTALMNETARRKSPTTPPSHAAYYAALELVTCIDQNLVSGRRHYRTKNGVLLTTLDEVINAMINRQLEGADQ